MQYTIIEDCSPFFIRFTFDGLGEIIDYVKENSNNVMFEQKFFEYLHQNLTHEVSDVLINMLPMKSQFDFNRDRVALFTTQPGAGCGIHKDGANCKVSLNIPVQVSDDKCITYWYDDSTFANSTVSGMPYGRIISRWNGAEIESIQKTPNIKTMNARDNEMVLFNTDIYHSWDNAQSSNIRKLLTLRILDMSLGFDDVKKIIFGL